VKATIREKLWLLIFAHCLQGFCRLASSDSNLDIPPEVRMPTPESVISTPPDPFGPTARYPFLPAKSQFGGPDLDYSVRFGGPKIYDLLGTLPMNSYGALKWMVLDREEEIFESDDLTDEHKVMHALWARWVMLHRWVNLNVYSELTNVL
jgi:hypothetical protein